MANRELKHFGVLGMRWGVRKSDPGGNGGNSSGSKGYTVEQRKNVEAGVNKMRKLSGTSSTNFKNIKKMSDKELDDELATVSMHYALNFVKKTAEHIDTNAADLRKKGRISEAEFLEKDAKDLRKGLTKMKSEIDTRLKGSLSVIDSAKKARLDKKIDERASKNAKDQVQANKVNARNKERLDSEIARAKSTGAIFNEKAARRALEPYYRTNYTFADVRRARIETGVAITSMALALIGTAAYTAATIHS